MYHEGILGGRSARKPVPNIEGLDTGLIQWVQDGTYVRLLGIPFWESGKYNVEVYFQALYDKCRCKLAAWLDHSMLANAMIYSRYRYQA